MGHAASTVDGYRTNVYRHNIVGMPFEYPWTWSLVRDNAVIAKGTTMTGWGARRRLGKAIREELS